MYNDMYLDTARTLLNFKGTGSSIFQYFKMKQDWHIPLTLYRLMPKALVIAKNIAARHGGYRGQI